jgi:membrane protease YdiL (CAAX protease family)
VSLREGLLLLTEYLGVIAVTLLLTLSPRFRHPPLVFRYPQREGGIALSLFGLIFTAAFVYRRIQAFQATSWISVEHLNLLGLSLLAFLGALVIRGQPARSAGWSRALLMPGIQLGLGLIFITLFLRGEFLRVLGGFSPEQTRMLFLSFLFSLGEESIFRGFLQVRWQAWLGQRWGWALTSLAFALWRLPWMLPASTGTLVLTFGLAFAQALILGWVMQKSGHVMAPVLYRTVSDWLRFI